MLLASEEAAGRLREDVEALLAIVRDCGATARQAVEGVLQSLEANTSADPSRDALFDVEGETEITLEAVDADLTATAAELEHGVRRAERRCEEFRSLLPPVLLQQLAFRLRAMRPVQPASAQDQRNEDGVNEGAPASLTDVAAPHDSDMAELEEITRNLEAALSQYPQLHAYIGGALGRAQRMSQMLKEERGKTPTAHEQVLKEIRNTPQRGGLGSRDTDGIDEKEQLQDRGEAESEARGRLAARLARDSRLRLKRARTQLGAS